MARAKSESSRPPFTLASSDASAARTSVKAFSTPAADKEEKDEDRIKDAGRVLTEILNVPDDIPQDLLDKAACVVVFPSVLKAAFIVGASYGRGVMTCRTGPPPP